MHVSRPSIPIGITIFEFKPSAFDAIDLQMHVLDYQLFFHNARHPFSFLRLPLSTSINALAAELSLLSGPFI
jgi:hypothetical protein